MAGQDDTFDPGISRRETLQFAQRNTTTLSPIPTVLGILAQSPLKVPGVFARPFFDLNGQYILVAGFGKLGL